MKKHLYDTFDILIVLRWILVQRENSIISVYIWLQRFNSYLIEIHEFERYVEYDICYISFSAANYVEIWLLLDYWSMINLWFL